MLQPATTVDRAAHVILRFGRLMMLHGSDSPRLFAAVTGLAQHFGYSASVMVAVDGLLLTLESEDGNVTMRGHSIGGPAINMKLLILLDKLVQDVDAGKLDIEAIDRHLDHVEAADHGYSPWLVAIGMGITAASLARLFGAEWPAVGVTVVVGFVAQVIRQNLTPHVNAIAVAGVSAFGGALVAALLMKLLPGVSPTLCFVGAGMILVPGIPLLNGVRDTLLGHVGPGISRLAFSFIMVLAITSGLFFGTLVASDHLPVQQTLPLLPFTEDLVVSAFAGLGFALLFDVPLRSSWVCMACSMAGHGFRTGLEHLGVDLALASLVGAFSATVLARLVARPLGAPSTVFAFPGVLAMIPGSYAFRAGVGGLTIMSEGAGTSLQTVTETLSLAVTAVVVTAAIAIGISLALVPLVPRNHDLTQARGNSQ